MVCCQLSLLINMFTFVNVELNYWNYKKDEAAGWDRYGKKPGSILDNTAVVLAIMKLIYFTISRDNDNALKVFRMYPMLSG